MYKKILTIFALAASLLACNKAENEVVAPENGAKTLTITATLGGPATRLSYSEATDGSYKARFNQNDVIWAYFAKADNSVAGSATKLAIDPKTISFDGKTACFRQPLVTIPEGATKIIAYLTNTANTTNFDGGDDIVSDISSQANLTAALNNQVIYGAVDFKDLTSTDPDALAASIPFSYKTSLLKFSLAIPEGTTVDPKAAVSVTMSGEKIHNKLHISGGVLGAKSEIGDLKLGGAVAGGAVTAYAAVWAGEDLSSKLTVNIGDDIFVIDFKPSAATEPGKVYTVERTLPSVQSKWVNDEAGSVDFPAGGATAVTEGFLSYADGKVSWTKNETGKPRSAKISFANGSSYEVTQVEAADFKGDWTLTSKIFANVSPSAKAADPGTTAVTFLDPLKPVVLKDAEGVEHTNNIGVKGLYFETILDACVEINYDAKTARVGFFLDARDGSGQEVNGKFAAYIPGLATRREKEGDWNKPWQYAETELGDPDYVWFWFTVASDLNTISYTNRYKNGVELQTLTQYTDKSMNQICGISIVLSDTNVFNHSTVSTTGNNGIGVYSNVYQCNPKNNPGEFFTRK